MCLRGGGKDDAIGVRSVFRLCSLSVPAGFCSEGDPTSAIGTSCGAAMDDSEEFVSVATIGSNERKSGVFDFCVRVVEW